MSNLARAKFLAWVTDFAWVEFGRVRCTFYLGSPFV